MENNKQFGDTGEKLACEYLIKVGYRIVKKNFRCKSGEIDIIAFDRDVLCFIEVKTRKNSAYGNPSDAVGIYKQNRIIKSALYFITQNNLFNFMSRFDIVEIIIDNNKSDVSYNLIKNAFSYSGKYGY